MAVADTMSTFLYKIHQLKSSLLLIDLKWTKFGTAENHDDVSLIPYSRVDGFITGECANLECPTRFHIEIQQETMSMIYLGISEENVLEKHIEGIQPYCGSNVNVNSLASRYVHKLGMIIKRSTHELDLDDQASIRMWADRNKNGYILLPASESDSFILGIQTEWQLQQITRFGHSFFSS